METRHLPTTFGVLHLLPRLPLLQVPPHMNHTIVLPYLICLLIMIDHLMYIAHGFRAYIVCLFYFTAFLFTMFIYVTFVIMFIYGT